MTPTRRAFGGLTAGACLTALAPSFTARAAPAGACDSHVHVIGDPGRFPMDPTRDYTPEPATAEDLKRHLASLGLERAVIVTPTIYGRDASATLDAIAALGRKRACGAAFVEPSASRSALERLAVGGIVAIRLFLTEGENFHRDAAVRSLKDATAIAAALGWHLQIATPPDVVQALERELLASPTPLVFDAFGWLADGVGQPGFATIRALMKAGVAYAKLAQPYKLSKGAPDYDDVQELARALVAANPDRVLWGSGWPHVPSGAGAALRTTPVPPLPIDTRHMYELLETWAPDPLIRQRILVDNPARLFRFEG